LSEQVATLFFTVTLAADAKNWSEQDSGASVQELQSILKQKQKQRDDLLAARSLQQLDSFNEMVEERSTHRDVVAPSMHGCKEELEEVEEDSSEDVGEEQRFKAAMLEQGMGVEDLDEEWEAYLASHPSVKCSVTQVVATPKPRPAVAKPRPVVAKPRPAVAKPKSDVAKPSTLVRVGVGSSAPMPKGTAAKKAKASPRPKGSVAQMPKTGTGQGLNIVFSMCADIL